MIYPTGTVTEIDAISWIGIREPFSSLSHFWGAILFVFLAGDLIRLARGDAMRLFGVAAFSICALQQLVVSGIYHSLWPGPAREFMLRADVSAVFLLIAGSVTPVHAILFRGLKRWGALALIWSVAIGAIVWRILFCQTSPGTMGIVFFLLCGWSCSFTGQLLHRRYGWNFIRPAILSGMAYTLGAIGLALKWPDPIHGVIGHHEIWHIAVMAGLILHWQFVRQFADGQPESLGPAAGFIGMPIATAQAAVPAPQSHQHSNHCDGIAAQPLPSGAR